MKEKIRIGCGAGFSGDRMEPSAILVERGNIDYLVMECLAERTIALAQKRKLHNPALGYDPLLERRMTLLLPLLAEKKVRLITNMGAANPESAAAKTRDIAVALGLNVTIAAVLGDDVHSAVSEQDISIETGRPVGESGKMVSANAYLGAGGIIDALHAGADIVITGRVADPSLFLAPMVYELGWSMEDYDKLGKGTVMGHLMECAGQITGGYFADPGRKDVAGMENLGHPYIDVFADGHGVIGKPAQTGGTITLATAKEQLLYEVIDPNAYYTPDVIADFTTVRFEQTATDIVTVYGGTGKPRPQTFKVSVGYQAGYLGEGEISYGGGNAAGRAQLAAEILSKRLVNEVTDLRVDVIGQTSLHGNISAAIPYEARVRAAGKAASAEQASRVGEEVEALYTNGPGGGGGVRKTTTEVIGVVSTLLPRTKASQHIKLFRS